jgi:hypothetical protein
LLATGSSTDKHIQMYEQTRMMTVQRVTG